MTAPRRFVPTASTAMTSPLVATVSGALLLAGLSGCPKSDEVEADTEAGTDGDGTASSSTAAADDTAGQLIDIPARGITIRQVDANSGVAIPLWVDGSPTPVDDRAPLPKNRNTAVRVFVDVDEDVWVQRDLLGRLTVVAPDGSETVLEETVTIAADSSETNLQSNFIFGVLAEAVVPDAEYRVELFEAGEGYEGLPEPTTAPAAPAEGTAALGARSSTQRMRVMMVPVQYTAPDGGECETTIDTSEENMQRYVDALYQHNPVEDIDLMMHEPLVVDDIDLAATGPIYVLLTRLSMLRSDEEPDPDVYYYALFDNCSACITSDGSGGVGGCLLGIAAGIPEPTQASAATRVAVGVTSSPSDAESGLETFVHEIGHGQGRNHVECPGQTSAGPDASYPHEDGSIGVWGFGVLDFGIRNPSNHTDYMSYCRPTWVSDWQWSATFDRIQEMSSWGFGLGDGRPAPGSLAPQLVGAVNPETGEAIWWTDRGAVDADAGATRWPVALRSDDGGSVATQAAVYPWSEGPWVTVRVPLVAAELDHLVGLGLAAPQRTIQTPASAIHRTGAAARTATAG